MTNKEVFYKEIISYYKDLLKQKKECDKILCAISWHDCIGKKRLFCSEDPFAKKELSKSIKDTETDIICIIDENALIKKEINEVIHSRVQVLFECASLYWKSDDYRAFLCFDHLKNTFAHISCYLPSSNKTNRCFIEYVTDTCGICTRYHTLDNPFNYYLAIKRIYRNPIMKTYITKTLDDLWKPGGKFCEEGKEMCMDLVQKKSI